MRHRPWHVSHQYPFTNSPLVYDNSPGLGDMWVSVQVDSASVRCQTRLAVVHPVVPSTVLEVDAAMASFVETLEPVVARFRADVPLALAVLALPS